MHYRLLALPGRFARGYAAGEADPGADMSANDPRARPLARGACVLALLPAIACKQGSTYECESVGRPVTEHEVLPDGSTLAGALELLGEWDAPAVWADDSQTELLTAITRAPGPAEWVEFHEGTRWEPFFTPELDAAIICPKPALHVPVVLTVVSDDGRVAIDAPAQAVAGSFEIDGVVEPGLAVDVSERLKDLEGMPDPEAWTDPAYEAELAVVYALFTARHAVGELGFTGETHYPAWNATSWSKEVVLRWDTREWP